MNNNVAVIDMNEYRYMKFQGVNLNDDIVFPGGHSNKKQFAKEYKKAYMKLLTNNIK
jgi:hypothetical protein